MRVFVGPRTDLRHDCLAAQAARALAGPGGEVVALRDVGVPTLTRPLSQAEVALMRDALRRASLRKAVEGAGVMGGASAEGEAVVGYLCRGVLLRPGATLDAPNGSGQTGPWLVAVSDHADLTWRSPLTGPNDASVGPRFPSMTGVYRPEAVLDRLGAVEGMIVMPGVVAGVRDDARPTVFEADMARALGHVAVSSELVPVVIVAAHMGLRVAAVLATGT